MTFVSQSGYWHVFPGAFDCPKEPFSQEFWKTQGAVLLHGIALPGVAEEDRGDLIVLLTQKMDGDDSAIGDKKITSILIREFYPRLLKLPFPHARLLAAAPTPLRKELIAELEKVFAEKVAPQEAYN